MVLFFSLYVGTVETDMMPMVMMTPIHMSMVPAMKTPSTQANVVLKNCFIFFVGWS